LRAACAITPEAAFRIFRLGQWVDGYECWLGDDGRALWRSLVDPYELEPGAPTWCGVDVALKHDSTAIAWCQRRSDGRLHVKVKVWLPKPDGRLDVTDAMHHLRTLALTYDVRSVDYDPRFFDLPAQQLADEGLPMVEVPQSVERMTATTGAAYEAIKRREVSHDGDAVFETQVLNGMARYNERGFTLAKGKSRDRIDAAVAMCLALHSALMPERRATPVLAAFG
jgi:phage terminase large subunit-like protein